MNDVQQVGGTHYQAAYQHWDWVLDTGLGYMEGNATAYVTRFKKKGGIVDLEKAVSYVEKMTRFWEGGGWYRPAGLRSFRNVVNLTRFLLANDLNDTPAGEIIKKIDAWETNTDLFIIRSNLLDLINDSRV